MRQIQTDPGDISSAANYAVAFILAGQSTTTATVGSGYAVALGNSGTTDPVRLVKYSSGVQGTVTNHFLVSRVNRFW